VYSEATATLLSVRCGIGCENFECTVKSGMFCDSFFIFQRSGIGLRELRVYSEDLNVLRQLLYLY